MKARPGAEREQPQEISNICEKGGPEEGKWTLPPIGDLIIALALCREATFAAYYSLHVGNVLCRQHYRPGVTNHSRRTEISRQHDL